MSAPDTRLSEPDNLPADLIRCRQERDDALRALRHMQQELADHQALTKVGTWHRGIDSEELYWSDQTYLIHGLPVGLPITRSGARKLIHEDDLERVRDQLEEAIAQRAPFRSVYRIRRPDGSIRVLHSDNLIAEDEETGELVLHGAVQDITEQEDRTAIIPFAGPGFPTDCLLVNLEGVILRSSGSMRSMVSNMETGSSIFRLFRSGTAHDALELALDRVEQNGKPEQIQLGLEEGPSGVEPRFGIAPWREGTDLRGFVITPVEPASRSKPGAFGPLNELGTFIRASGGWQFDPETSTTVWSQGMYAILDIDPDMPPMSGEDLAKLVHPEDQAAYRARIERFWANRQPTTWSFRIITPRGRTKLVAAHMEDLYRPDGPAQAFGTLTDLSDAARFDDSSREQILQVRTLQETLEHMNHRLLEANLRLSKAQEEERGRIAVDLHDHAGGLITSLSLKLALMESEGAGPHLDEAKQMLDELGNQIRRTTRQLRPNVLNRFGIDAALKELAEDMAAMGSLELVFDSGPSMSRLDSRTATGVFRIAREAMLNVIRHAHASTLSVSMRIEDHLTLLTIEDDGIGFDLEATRSHSTIGLESMFDTADSQGIRLNIRPRTGGGTSVELFIPAS